MSALPNTRSPRSTPCPVDLPNGANDKCGHIVQTYLNGYARLQALLTRRTGCSVHAADILQDTFLQLGRRPGEPIANPQAYIGRVAMNLATDRHRKAAYRSRQLGMMALDPIAEVPSVERELLGRERLRQVLEAADRLPPRCREVFVLRKIDGLTQQEIASRLGISANMVQKHLRKALADIMAALAALD